LTQVNEDEEIEVKQDCQVFNTAEDNINVDLHDDLTEH